MKQGATGTASPQLRPHPLPSTRLHSSCSPALPTTCPGPSSHLPESQHRTQQVEAWGQRGRWAPATSHRGCPEGEEACWREAQEQAAWGQHPACPCPCLKSGLLSGGTGPSSQPWGCGGRAWGWPPCCRGRAPGEQNKALGLAHLCEAALGVVSAAGVPTRASVSLSTSLRCPGAQTHGPSPFAPELWAPQQG